MNNVKIEGSIISKIGSTTIQLVPRLGYNIGPCVLMRYQPTEKQIIGPNNVLDIIAEFSDFGDASEDDVTEGKTFTSGAGFKKTGTKVVSSGSGVETIVGHLTSSAPSDNYEIFGNVYYTDADGNLQVANTANDINVMKNTLIFAVNGGEGDPQQYSGNIEVVHDGGGISYTQGYMLYRVTGEFGLSI